MADGVEGWRVGWRAVRWAGVVQDRWFGGRTRGLADVLLVRRGGGRRERRAGLEEDR